MAMTQPNHRLPRFAFSLAELVAVITIVGILAAMAIPRFASAAARQQAEAATRRISADLKLAQRLAKASSVAHRLHINKDRNAYRIERRDADKTWTPVAASEKSSADYMVLLGAAPYEAVVTNVTSNGILEFNPYGLPQRDFGVVLRVGGRWVALKYDAVTGEIVTVERQATLSLADAQTIGSVVDEKLKAAK